MIRENIQREIVQIEIFLGKSEDYIILIAFSVGVFFWILSIVFAGLTSEETEPKKIKRGLSFTVVLVVIWSLLFSGCIYYIQSNNQLSNEDNYGLIQPIIDSEINKRSEGEYIGAVFNRDRYEEITVCYESFCQAKMSKLTQREVKNILNLYLKSLYNELELLEIESFKN